MSGYARPEILVETDWLADHLNDPNLRIFDCTTFLIPDPDTVFRVESGLGEYQGGHIPGAGFLDLQEELSDPSGEFRFTTPGANAFAAAVGAKGLGSDGDCRVVLYSAGTMWWATRIWWMLYAFGFEDAAILNGGMQKWQDEGRPVSTAACQYPAATFAAQARPGRIVGKDAVLAALEDEGAVVVNALTRSQHEGTSKTHYGRPGRISGSVCLPGLDLLDRESNTFLDADGLRGKFAKAGIGMDKKVVTYCGGGIAATADSVALALLGHQDVGIYDNSLNEWANDHSLPMESDGD